MEVCGDKPAVQQQTILRELHTFLTGATHAGKVRNPEVARSAVFLLKTLPAAREAVLEHMNNLFDEAVNNYILKLELEDNSTIAGNVMADETTVQEVHGVLSGFIETNPDTWAPIISNWALDLLGNLSSRYADRRVVPHPSYLPEVLQLWMACRPARTLMDLTTQCLSTLSSHGLDACINALLETSMQHSAHFDWVVAHIGSCFPDTVITRVLACGLKDFCSRRDASRDPFGTTGKSVSKMGSVVGILGHLVGRHADDIRRTLVTLFRESLVLKPNAEQLATIPFLLHLTFMSDLLLHVVTSEYVDALTNDTLNVVVNYVNRWKGEATPGTDGLVELVVHLLLKSNQGGYEMIKFLLQIAESKKSDTLLPEVHWAAGLILDTVLLEIERRIHGHSAEIPLLHSLKQCMPEMCQYVIEQGRVSSCWMVSFLRFLCIHGGEKISTEVLGYFLCTAGHRDQLVAAESLLRYIELQQSNVLTNTIAVQFAELKSGRMKDPAAFVKNLVHFTKMEPCRDKMESMIPHLETLATQAMVPGREYVDAIIEILSLVAKPEFMTMSSLQNVISAAVTYFFTVIGTVPSNKKLKPLMVCQKLLATLSQQSAGQQMVLRMLLEEVLNAKNSSYFGSLPTLASIGIRNKTDCMPLMTENSKHATTVTLPMSHTSIFHAGIVGKGLRQQPKLNLTPKDGALFNRQIFLSTLQACCEVTWRFPSEKISTTKPSLIPGMKTVALLLVELVSLDVMFNGLPWPDEEFLKVTIERDLHIKKQFDEHPVLWDLLFLTATIHPSLCYCSVLLRAIMAIVISHWASSQERITTNCPKQLEVTQLVLEAMAIGQLLPPPLCHVGQIMPYLTPFEAFCLLSDIWQYMRDNVPSPALFTIKDDDGHVWRDFTLGEDGEAGGSACNPKYTSRLRHILLANIAKLGGIYATFFQAQ